MHTNPEKTGSACHIATEPDYTNVTIIELSPTEPISDFNAAKILANQVADKELGEHMLLAFRDGDRDFNSPEHGDECHSQSPVPAYIDYALYHGATLKVDIESGRFEFFYVGF
ncbi:MAG TPA: hypothetical protein ENJ33_08310 [Thiothrix sp.]|nr:hypothetical protein [Thiothrix sp.]